MNHDDILYVQQSWRKVLPMKETAAALFYRRLFQLDPTLRALFTSDMEQQGVKLIQMISAAVRALDRLDVLLPVVRELGSRHLAYGVRDEHYGSVGSALLWTLEQALREQFTPEVKSAWIKTYGVLSQTMRESALSPAAA
jgi:hemoglobin-like flavoprotein